MKAKNNPKVYFDLRRVCSVQDFVSRALRAQEFSDPDQNLIRNTGNKNVVGI
jgi:hypothetical protein